MKQQPNCNPAGELPDLDIEEVLTLISALRPAPPEQTEHLIAHLRNPADMSFEELTNIEDL